MPVTEPAVGSEETVPCPQGISVVGIGASAGGLEACSALLKNLPEDTGLAFVVVQHLHPTHESLLPTLLGRITKIPVKHATDGMLVEPNQVYVMPPNVGMLFANGRLNLMPRENTSGGVRLPIDNFFGSLAENCFHRAIGVILSGTGSDGTVGLEMIKARGGITFAQDTQSAKFGGMPYSASVTGFVDFVLPPEGIARELVKISKYSYAERIESAASEEGSTYGPESLRDVLTVLHEASGVDFSQYRFTTVQRRVFRRMAIHHIADASAYCKFLRENPREVELLCDEMIPRVTKFFRDRDVFQALRHQVFAKILAERPKDAAVRVWVPGCASGEEVYAIAICLLEACTEIGAHCPIQIFGTDLSPIAIQKARQGLYPERIAQDVSDERLKRFFMKRDEGYQISSDIRALCVFAVHDLINDPPYSKLDLISCRNVLIYLDSVQTRIMPMFHFALNSDGYLILGLMETARRFSDLFAPLDKGSQIYSKNPVMNRHLRGWGSVKAAAPVKHREPSDSWDDAELQKRADRAVLAKYAPAGVVVNENLQVLQVRGKVGPYLEMAAGKMSASLLAMAKQSGLAPDLSAMLNQARNENTPVRRERIGLAEQEQKVNLHVIPLGMQGESRAYLVLFEQAEGAKMEAPETVHESSVPKDEFVKIQEELADARERLATLLDNYQDFADDTQSEQEESLSNLEEIQSFNEELETAKEELQSTNEELLTVNEELQTRNSDLQQARDFTVSIVETIRQPLVVLDDARRVKMANRSFYETFHLSHMETEGRPFFDLAHGTWNTPELRLALEKVVPDDQAFEEFELTYNFPNAGRKTLCIGARRLNMGEMILICIEDATDRKAAQTELLRAQDELRQGQKMEAIGRLAGGVAHDFNNLLTAILGFSDLLQMGLQEDSEAYRQASEIKKAGERASALTQQLLALSRRQVLRPQSLNLNTVIHESHTILRRLIGEDIELVTTVENDLWPIHADSGQLSQIIINLALNARDAMPNGGVLSIRTENNIVEDTEERVRGLKSGEYVTLTISDSGSGMDPETQQRIFEPFFTTKPQGSGTGLGLATVFGIVEQSGGTIWCTSELGVGTTFWIDLPRAELSPAVIEASDRAQAPTGTETILIVEDEDMVRRVAGIALRRLGYTVLEVGRGSEGLELCRSHPTAIDVMLTDVVMPGGMNGRQLAEQAVAIRPALKVIMMSGHTTDGLVHYGVKRGAPFLQKPFTIHQLARKVRDVLGSVAEGKVFEQGAS